jgi:hypothetical protein
MLCFDKSCEKMVPDLIVDNKLVLPKQFSELPNNSTEVLPRPPPLPPNFIGCQPLNFVPFWQSGVNEFRPDPALKMEISEVKDSPQISLLPNLS